MDYGIRVSPPGSDVTVEEKKNLRFSTDTTLKIFKTGFITLTTDGSGNGRVWVSHGLSYPPAFFVFQRGNAHWATMDATTYGNAFIPDLGVRNNWASDYNYNLGVHCYTDNKNIYFEAASAGANLTYELKYYILVDLAQDFSGTDPIITPGNYGMKVSKDGFDVKDAKEYQLAYSQKYKSLQYYPSYAKKVTLTLPQMFASPIDTFQDEGVYVDFLHPFKYPPFFIAYFSTPTATDPTARVTIPYEEYNGSDILNYHIASFCDKNRVRISFYRTSTWVSSLLDNWPSETITVYCFIFTEDLNKVYG